MKVLIVEEPKCARCKGTGEYQGGICHDCYGTGHAGRSGWGVKKAGVF